ncbi:MAG: LacI family DNA-binding transcriptional regulator [Streptosporangiaceae bacterium]
MMASEPRLARDRVTLADIAAAAGVSVPTVSKVLNGHADVAPKTRSRVEALLADYNYAAPRRAGRSCLIDLVFADLSPWAVEIIRGAEEAASAEGCRIAVSVVSGEPDTEQWLTRLSTSQTDGVILVLTELSPAYRARLAAMHMPVVIVDPVGQPDPRIPSIGATNWAGGLMATEHLIEIGHRRIGTITGRPSLLCSQARLDGYRAALERAGIPADPALVYSGDFHFEAALVAATDMLKLDDPPTAIFAGSDMQAMGVYEAARLHRQRIPDDLSVVGFDDLPMSGWVSPPLTTIVQPLAQMAAMATRTILALLDGRTDTSSNRVELTTSLVVRASTAPPRKKAGGRGAANAGPAGPRSSRRGREVRSS